MLDDVFHADGLEACLLNVYFLRDEPNRDVRVEHCRRRKEKFGFCPLSIKISSDFSLFMRFGVHFYTESGLGNVPRAKAILLNEFGLVPSNDSDPDVLVWEDSTGVGRYRIHFYENDKVIDKVKYDGILFQYWLPRAKKEILEKDPMNSTINQLKGRLEGRVLEGKTWDFSIVNILRDYCKGQKPNCN
ncbi:MAG: hypothetical protein V1866_01600 [archaeon]